MTPAQGIVLQAIRRISADGWPVTISEIQADVGHASRSTTWVHLVKLEEQGLIVRHPRYAHGGYLPA